MSAIHHIHKIGDALIYVAPQPLCYKMLFFINMNSIP